MSDTEHYLDTFPGWLRSLGEDALCLAALINEESLPLAARESLTGGLNYLFKSLDLIPDGIDDIGYLDDAFVLRIAADQALVGLEDASSPKLDGVKKLADDCELLRTFLDANYPRLAKYVQGLRTSSARGRSVGDVLSNAEARATFVTDVHGFASGYETPSFSRQEKNLIKLKAFFDAKLPRA